MTTSDLVVLLLIGAALCVLPGFALGTACERRAWTRDAARQALHEADPGAWYYVFPLAAECPCTPCCLRRHARRFRARD